MQRKSSIAPAITRRGALIVGCGLAAAFSLGGAILTAPQAHAAEGGSGHSESEGSHGPGGKGRGGSNGKRSGRTGVEHDILHDSGHGGRSSGVKGKVLGGHDEGGESEEEGHK